MPLNVNDVERLAEAKLAEMRDVDLRKWLLLQAMLARARRIRHNWERVRFAPLFTVLPSNGNGAPGTSNDEGDYAAFSLRYYQAQLTAVDTRSMEIKPANHNTVYIVFWKRFPPE
ncbi:hypothetical protein MTO96_031409 [Rhipicephalus appendiculatus]